jgi:hypothetical protein
MWWPRFYELYIELIFRCTFNTSGRKPFDCMYMYVHQNLAYFNILNFDENLKKLHKECALQVECHNFQS